MAIANVGARWSNGDQVFFSKITGATIMTLKGDGTLEINGFGQAEAQADSTATEVAELVADHNAMLAKFRAAGLMAAD